MNRDYHLSKLMSETLKGSSSGEKSPLGMEGLRDVLATAIRAGQLMLQAGAATARVEEVIHRIGTALGADWMDIYVTPTGIIGMATSGGEHRTRVMRVVNLGVNLGRVHTIYLLSRRIESEGLSREDVEKTLERIASQPRFYGPWLTCLAAGLGCAGFAWIFGGRLPEIAATLLAAATAQRLRTQLLHWNVSLFVTTVLDTLVAAVLALGVSTLLAAKLNTVILASVLFLVPGVFLVGSISDLISGNLMSGMARGVHAGLIIASIGAGLWIAVLVFGIRLQ